MLEIFPPTSDRSIQPIDRADTYLLEVLHSLPSLQGDITAHKKPSGKERFLLVNDRYGALHTGLGSSVAWGIQDSFNGSRGILHNMQKLGTEPLLSGTLEIPKIPELATITGVVLKIPKGADLFAMQLSLLAQYLPKGTPIWAGGMVKYLPKRFFEIFSTYTTESAYTLAKGKARLYTGKLVNPASLDTKHPATTHATAAPFTKQKTITLPNTDKSISYISYPGVFSYKRLDGGTEFLLSHFPRVPQPHRIVDLGCGSGILLTAAALQWPQAELIGTDDSSLAIAATRESASLHNLSPTLMQTHIAEGIADATAQLVLCNPPFHQDHRVSMDLGLSFVSEAARILQEGGYLALVANKHLGYKKILENEFSQTKIIGQNSRYRVYLSKR